VAAIQERLLQEVPEVRKVFVFENREDVVVDGRPAHSIEVVVDVADNAGHTNYLDVAKKILELKPVGISTYHRGGSSNPHEEFVDAQGVNRVINFSLPTRTYIWVKATVTTNDDLLPVDWKALVRSNILEMAATIRLGEGVLVQKFYTPILTVAGIEEVELGFASNSSEDFTPENGDYSDAIISISPTGLALFADTEQRLSIQKVG
jgi:hypothetical protein